MSDQPLLPVFWYQSISVLRRIRFIGLGRADSVVCLRDGSGVWAEKPRSVASADFHGVNTRPIANFKLQTSLP